MIDSHQFLYEFTSLKKSECDLMVNMTEKIIGAIGIVVITIVLISMTPTIVDAVQSMVINATDPATEWNFTGSAGALQLIGLVPFVWIAGILISSAVGMFALAKSKD